MLKRPEMVLIDVDGTLVDSVPDLAFCVDEMLKQLDMRFQNYHKPLQRN